MSDILTDYREWRSQQEERIGTHSDGCHMWPRHERCMIHRLAAEVERLRLTVPERDVLEFVAAESHVACGAELDILRGMLERLK